MSATTHPHGFRIVGPVHGDRRRVDAAAAFRAYCHCDPKAAVDQEGYLSAFQFADDFGVHLAATGSPASFAGSTWAPILWFDNDRSEADGGLARALDDTRKLVNTFDERYGVPRDSLLPFVSGYKGCHLGVLTAFFAPSASVDFHAIARQFAEQIAGEAGVAIDSGVYDRLRAFRLPNSKHPKSGRHKRYIPVDVLDLATADGLLAMARTPEPFDVPNGDGVESVDFLVAAWDRATRAVAARAAVAEQRQREIADGTRAANLNPATRAFLAGDVAQGDRHRLLYSAARNLAELGCPLPAVRALLTEPALDLGIPPRDVPRGIDCGHAAANKPKQNAEMGAP